MSSFLKFNLHSALVANELEFAPLLSEDSCARLNPRCEKSYLKGPQGTAAKTTPPLWQGMAAETTPPLRVAQKPWGGHPSCDPAPLTTSFGTVGQGYPVTGQRWNERKGDDPRTDHVTKGADSELPGWQPKEKVP